MATTETSFPDGFLWGASTSAYQIEGAVTRGRSLAEHLGQPLPCAGCHPRG